MMTALKILGLFGVGVVGLVVWEVIATWRDDRSARCFNCPPGMTA